MDNISEKINEPNLNMILHDLSDCVMVIDRSGSITYVNSAGSELLGLSADNYGSSLEAVLMASGKKENDGLYRLYLEAAGNKGSKRFGTAKYSSGDIKRDFEVSAESHTETGDTVLIFNDISERVKLEEHNRFSSIVVAVFFFVLCFSVILYNFFEYYMPGQISPSLFAVIEEIIAIIMVVLVPFLTGHHYAPIIPKGADHKRDLKVGGILFVAVFVVLVILKLILLALNSQVIDRSLPFINFKAWDLSYTLYPFTVFIQEILSRVIMQESLEEVFAGKHAVAFSIIISSLIFSALHLNYGFIMMLGSFILLSVFGIVYSKTRNILPLCFVHFSLGTFGGLLGII